ncbi:uncharacterized protein LOC108605319 [Drosophila busckii]|uniref:uncharacterized protein LOC108605319 n=1 Tax=Drosophila busckii TaxID=30019 RepID=UPI00083EECE1|nr:uncharacterized protein LOC108605319 [Drosophila busckii]
MDRVLMLLAFIAAAEGAILVQNNSAEVVIELYNEKLDFFATFLSPDAVDALIHRPENISLNTTEALRYAWIPYTTLKGEIETWCIGVENTIPILDDSHSRVERGRLLAHLVAAELSKMQKLLNAIVLRKEPSKFYAQVLKAQSILKEALSEIHAATNNIYNRGQMLATCKRFMYPPPTTTTPTTTTTTTTKAPLPPKSVDKLKKSKSAAGLTKPHYIFTTLFTTLCLLGYFAM